MHTFFLSFATCMYKHVNTTYCKFILAQQYPINATLDTHINYCNKTKLIRNQASRQTITYAYGTNYLHLIIIN